MKPRRLAAMRPLHRGAMVSPLFASQRVGVGFRPETLPVTPRTVAVGEPAHFVCDSGHGRVRPDVVPAHRKPSACRRRPAERVRLDHLDALAVARTKMRLDQSNDVRREFDNGNVLYRSFSSPEHRINDKAKAESRYQHVSAT